MVDRLPLSRLQARKFTVLLTSPSITIKNTVTVVHTMPFCARDPGLGVPSPLHSTPHLALREVPLCSGKERHEVAMSCPHFSRAWPVQYRVLSAMRTRGTAKGVRVGLGRSR